MRLLRKDDSGSLQGAVDRLSTLIEQNPKYFEARADAVIAMAFHLENLRLEAMHYKSEADARQQEIQRLKRDRTSGDWESRINSMIDEIAALKAKSDPLAEQMEKLDQRLGKAFEALQDPGRTLSTTDQRALVRAQAVYSGTKGNEQALQLSEKYRQLAPENDGWGTIAFSEFVANKRVDAASAERALQELESLRKSDSTFIRGYLLSGRISWTLRKPEVAATSFELVNSLNPKHDLSKKLLNWVRAEEGSPDR
jgi:chromosome segregation ATPase